MLYRGSCHCGKISFQVEGDIAQVVSCNCSICQRRGHLLWFVPRERLTLLTLESDVSTYTFNTGRIKHQFCNVCGCGPYGEGVDPSGVAMAAVNVRCLENIELSGLKVVEYDGRSL